MIEYDDSYCDLLIELSKKGRTLHEFAAQLNIPISLVQKWANEYDNFAYHIEVAQTQYQAYLERQGRLGLWAGNNFNSQVWSKFLGAKCVEYQDIKNVNIGGQKDNPLKFDDFNLTNLTDQELEVLKTLTSK